MRSTLTLILFFLASCAGNSPAAVECKQICSRRAEQMVRCDGTALQQADAARARCEQENRCDSLQKSLFSNGFCADCCDFDLQTTCEASPQNCRQSIWLP